MSITRRDALKGAAASLAANACRPSTQPGPLGFDTGAEGQIDHVILVMMENRSFDHWLGARKLLEDITAEDGLTADMRNSGPDGDDIFPFASEVPCLSDPPHGWGSSHAQFNEGANDGFCLEYAARVGGDGAGVMSYQTRTDLPITWALADAFTVCDRYFCSVMGPTWPNRLFGHMASSQGKFDNSFPQGTVGFTEHTVWKALEAAGLEWRYYFSDLPFIGLFSDHWDDQACRMIESFYDDCAAGDLPPVCWVDPAFDYNDNHPPHHPGRGELFIGSIYEALATSPAWDRCLLVLTYDEHGGFFDHVPPPTTEDDRAADGFDQLGFRVPTQVIGPWVRQGVDSTIYDHTSWIKLVCELHDIEPWNKRLQAATSLASALDTDRMARGDPLPPVELPAFDLDPEAEGEGCDYFGPPPPRLTGHLHRLERFCRRRGYPVRLLDPATTRRMFREQWQRRGLIG